MSIFKFIMARLSIDTCILSIFVSEALTQIYELYNEQKNCYKLFIKPPHLRIILPKRLETDGIRIETNRFS